ncbi:hypothetical protein CPB85DRAFT_1299400 [Mucidula mucida]|nr:hypothetical protein CPB85DRAFT_1299400 [Mucidula mucida]
MRAFSIVATAAALFLGVSASSPMAARQEAARFGSVNVSPSTVSTGDSFEITYNSTLARFKPDYVDFFIQGTRSNGNPTPYVVLSRHDYGGAEGQTILTSTETTPDLASLGPADSYLVWAFVTYPNEGLEMYGGTSAPIAYQS